MRQHGEFIITPVHPPPEQCHDVLEFAIKNVLSGALYNNAAVVSGSNKGRRLAGRVLSFTSVLQENHLYEASSVRSIDWTGRMNTTCRA